MYKEIRIFFTALMFYTRIPCPKWVDHDPIYMKESARYFSLIGWIVGAISAGTFWLTSQFLPTNIAIILSMIVSIRATGAFHEDGLADVADGFGGGWTKDKILEIMKDSRLGTFGVTALICILGLKFTSLAEMPKNTIPLAILMGNVLSRTIASRMLYRGDYVQNNNLAKAGSAADKLSITSLVVNILFGGLTFLLFMNAYLLLIIPILILLEYLMYRFYKKWIGGYNGDCAGAVQQISEVVIYMMLLILWKLF